MAAGAKESQAELVGLWTFVILWWRTITDVMSSFDCCYIPAHHVCICRVELLLNLLFGGTLNTNGVGELDIFVAVDMFVIAVDLEKVHHLAAANKVIDEIFDLLR